MTASLIAVELLVTLALAIVALLTLNDTAARGRWLRERASGTSSRRWSQRVQSAANRWLRRTVWGSAVEQRLLGAGLNTTVFDFVLVVGTISLLVGALFRPFFGNLGAIVLVLGIVALANRWIENRRQKRLEAFVAQLPEVARVLSNAASAGLALTSAVDLAARELEEPASTEMREVASQVALGKGLPQALEDLRRRLPSRELAVLVQTLVIQSRAGGALVSALTNIASTLEQRKELRREVRTATSGAIFSGYVVVALGVGSVFVMNLLSPGALDQLAKTTIGRIVLILAFAFFAVGMLLIRRLTDIEI
jgi:tight adherence protein B